MQYDKNNIFSKIIKGALPANKVYEDDRIIVIHDIKPEAQVHILFIPKGEYTDFSHFMASANNEEITHYFKIIDQIIHTLDISEGYRIITNKGKAYGQTVFHFHTHLLGGKEEKILKI